MRVSDFQKCFFNLNILLSLSLVIIEIEKNVKREKGAKGNEKYVVELAGDQWEIQKLFNLGIFIIFTMCTEYVSFSIVFHNFLKTKKFD